MSASQHQSAGLDPISPHPSSPMPTLLYSLLSVVVVVAVLHYYDY